MGKKTQRTPRPPGELEQKLSEQIEFLKSSAAAYDAGNESEYQRIASTIRLLVHDTRQSTSLLRQLGLKESKGFYSISVTIEKSNPKFGYNGLILVFGTEAEAAAAPYLDGPSSLISPGFDQCIVSFSQWWDEPICRTSSRVRFTRAQLVLRVANEDGGAHVDTEVDADFATLIHTNSLGLTLMDGKEVRNRVAASIRHIGHELLKTLISDYSTVNSDPGGLTLASEIAGPAIVSPAYAPRFSKGTKIKISHFPTE